MRITLTASLIIAALLSAGCVTSSKINDSSLRGFCYQAGGNKLSCDNIAICDQYLAVLNSTQPSQTACMQACVDIDRNYERQNPVNECNIVSKDGLSWCQRYCGQTYPNK